MVRAQSGSTGHISNGEICVAEPRVNEIDCAPDHCRLGSSSRWIFHWLGISHQNSCHSSSEGLLTRERLAHGAHYDLVQSGQSA
jgi:hypothetical protein